MIANLMLTLAAALGAAYLGNRLLQEVHGDRVLYTVVPWWEEACKTGLSLLLGAPILPVHIAFGLTEMLYDWLRPTSTGVFVGSLALVGHTGAGLVTWGVASRAPAWLAYLAAGALHMYWNRLVARMIANRQPPGLPGGMP